jgi:hypothetical protein
MITTHAAQEFVPIKDIKDGVIVMPNGGLRAILLTSSINFELKSADVQQAIILQFQNFLNSLDFSVQIFIESRRFNIAPYLALLEERYRSQKEDLMRIQIREYIEFVRTFIEHSDIMTKSFFVVVPYEPAIVDVKSKGTSLFGKFMGRDKNNSIDSPDAALAAEKNFAENIAQLRQRVTVVIQGLTATGLRVVELGNEEVVELLYRVMNPMDVEEEVPKVG